MKLPEELQGIVTKTQWEILNEGGTIVLGVWKITGHPVGSVRLAYLGLKHKNGTTLAVVSYDPLTRLQGLYAGLQLALKEPEYLLYMKIAHPAGGCLNLSF